MGRTTDYSYDEAGNLVGINGELGFSASFTYDEAGNVTSQTDALNRTTQFTYVADSNNLSGFKDARGNDVLYSYDSSGNLTNIIYEDGTQNRYVYDANGLLTKSINRRGQEIAYEYNNNYQITKETHSDGSIIEYEYGATTGLLSGVSYDTNDSITRSNFNQTENRVTIQDIRTSVGILHSYSFDELGRKAQITIQDGTNTYTTNYSYDNLGRLDRLTDGSGNLIVDYDYHPISGQLARETNGNGTYTTYSYDLAGQLTSLVNLQADGTVNSRFDYTYDNLGRRTELATLDGTWSYSYDLTGQLTGAVFASTNADIESQNLTYVYDAAGNRIQTVVNGVTENYTTNNLNQYESAGTTTYNYDLDGNLTSKVRGSQTWTYSYDDNNRLVSVVDSDSNLTQYEYDAFGNRTATVYNGQRTEYLIDPFGYGDVIAEYDGDGNLIAKYEHGVGLVSRTDAGNNQSFYDFDGTGSTAGLTGTAGTELNSYVYRPFGEDFHEVETVDNSFEYVGQWGITEEANGLDFMRARYYDSHSGRFVASDPIGLQGNDSNFYRYVNNDPANFIDPEGTVALPAYLVSAGVGFSVGFGLDCIASGGAFGDLAGLAASRRIIRLARNARDLRRGATASGIIGGGASGLGASTLHTIFTNPGTTGLIGAYLGGVVADRLCGGDIDIANAAPPPSDYAEGAEDGIGAAEQSGSPLVLDLDGDGIELTALESPTIYFDVDGDGFREATGWVQPDDGLLVFDRNNDGYINDNSELFGNFNTSGFVELRAIDDNNDGFIDAADSNFSNLQVWRDLDTDGHSDVNELYSLSELDITRISAVANNVNIDNAGNTIKETTFYELGDGTTREIVDAWFQIHQLNSYYDHHSTYNEPLVITEEILNLPNLKGYGNLPDLRVAMAKDAELVTLVQSFSDTVASGDIPGSRDLIVPILYRWAGVEGIDHTSRGNYVDAQELRFLERFIGRNWRNSDDNNLSNPGFGQGANVEAVFDQLLPELETRLLVQDVDSLVDYNTVTESYIFPGSIDEAVSQFQGFIAQLRTTSSQETEIKAIAIAKYIRQEGEYTNWIFGDIDNDQLSGNAEAEELYGFIGNDTLDAGDNNDLLDGGSGNDTLDGGEGDDTLYGGEGDDTVSGGNGINLLYAGNGHDSMISGSGEDSLYGGAGNDTLKGGRSNDVYYGGDGNDLIEDIRANYVWYTAYTSDNDTLDGGTGNDTLKGGGNDDTYFFQKGYGNDVISDYGTSKSAYLAPKTVDGGNNDTLIFGSGITRSNLNWNFDGKDLTFTLTDSPSDSLTIENYYHSFYRIENIQVDGSQLTADEIFNNIVWQDTSETNSFSWLESAIAFKGLAGNDVITTGNYDDQLWGDNGDDRLNSGGGNDTLYGGAGDDSLNSGDGDDTLYGSNGNDTLISGNGNNLIVAGNDNDSLSGGSGQDRLYAGTGNDTLRGGYGNDIYYGEGGDDLIEENYNNNLVDRDTLDGGTGNDTLKGGGNDDTYFFQKGYGNDVISDYGTSKSAYLPPKTVDGGNNDTLIFGSGITRSNLNWNFDGKDLTFTLTDSPSDSLTIENYYHSFYRIENIQVDGSQLTMAEIMTSRVGEDSKALNSLNWTDSAITFKGLAGNDTLTSGNYDDQLWGDNGDDQIKSNGGNDTLYGGSNNDSLDGGSGDDILNGGAGDDTLIGSIGADTLNGGTGNDTYQINGYTAAGIQIEDIGGDNDLLTINGLSLSLESPSAGISGIQKDNQDLIIDLNQDGIINSDVDLTLKNFFSSSVANQAGTGFIEQVGNLAGSEILNFPFTIGEFGRVDNFNHNSQTIELNNTYINPVVFALPLSLNGVDPAIVRITDIQNDSFTAYLQEAEYKNGIHTDESFSYVVLEAGTWELEDGQLLEVGMVNTNLLTTDGWENINFNADFDDTPVILSQVQTNNDSEFVRTRQKQASVNGFRLTMEEEEALISSGHGTENVGWLAIESGIGEWGDLKYQAGHTGNQVNHLGHTVNFTQSFDNAPYLFASLASYNGGDSSGIRYTNLSNTQFQILVEEDQSLDTEIDHANEIVDFWAVSGTGDLVATAYEPLELT